MFTLLRPELPKASIKPLNLHLAQSPKITTRAVYLKVTGASGFYPLAALSAEPWLARDSFPGVTRNLRASLWCRAQLYCQPSPALY